MASISHAHTGVMPNRPHDYIYDPTFTVSSHKDHVKQMTLSQAQQVIINPAFENMFSALRHYPPMHFRLKVNPFPEGIGQDRRTVIEPHAVSGQNRFKYFRRPVMPYQPVFLGQIVYAKKKQADLQQMVVEEEPKTKTVSVQTIYRIAETQTDPYSPEYVFKPNEPPPELLALASLSYGQGLPAGVAELEMIERARVKREWEASLPVVTDKESFDKRLKMMEEMELREWEDREIEIKKLQEARLEILEKIIRQRERENDVENDKRIERIWQRKMQEREACFEKINRKRIKAMRKLQDQRNRVEMKREKRDIISEYGNYGSRVYAPRARDGVFRDMASTTLQVKLEDIEHYEGLIDLEKKLPKTVFELQSKQVKKAEDSPASRKERALKDQLEKMNLKLVERKEKQNQVKQPLKYAIKIEKPPVRPPTPTINAPSEEYEEMEIAAFMLQNLIRGRAAQEQMRKKKIRRLELINEMHARFILKESVKTDEDLGSTKSLYSHLDEHSIAFESAVQAEYVGRTLDFLTKQLVRLREEKRLAAMVKLAERTRRMREAEESGKRQEELIRQKKQDTIFKQIMCVHQETVDSYLEQIVGTAIESTAELQAKQNASEFYTTVYGTIDSRPEEEIVQDLVFSFLIPYASRSITTSVLENSQEKYLLAAHKALYEEVKRSEDEELHNQVIENIVEINKIREEGSTNLLIDGQEESSEYKVEDKLDQNLPPLPQ